MNSFRRCPPHRTETHVTDQVKIVDLPFGRALFVFHSSGADLRQVEQPLALLRLLRPVYVQGDGVRQALPQIDDLKMDDQANARAATDGWICFNREESVLYSL